MDLKTVAELIPGEKINYEYAPSREADAEVVRVVDEQDGTWTIVFKRFGAVSGWTDNDMVLVVG